MQPNDVPQPTGSEIRLVDGPDHCVGTEIHEPAGPARWPGFHVREAVLAHAGVNIGDAELAQLMEYLHQIDSSEAASPPQPIVAPLVTRPGNENDTVGVAVSLQVVASDGSSDPFTYSATGPPAGLSTGSTTGTITGTPTRAQARTVTVAVTVTASNGRGGNGSAILACAISADTDLPTAPSNLPATVSKGHVSLTWRASADNVGVAPYSIDRSTN